MHSKCLLIAFLVFAFQAPAQAPDVSYAPLWVTTQGGGVVYFCQDGQMLQVGRRYAMAAVPDLGHEFTGWTKVNVFNFIEFLYDENGKPFTRTSSVPSLTMEVITYPVLVFTMQPEVVVFTSQSREVTQTVGWQANFVSRY